MIPIPQFRVCVCVPPLLNRSKKVGYNLSRVVGVGGWGALNGWNPLVQGLVGPATAITNWNWIGSGPQHTHARNAWRSVFRTR